MPAVIATPFTMDDVVALIPKPSTAIPTSEAASGNAGTNSDKFSMEGHSHARLTSAHVVTTDSSGVAQIAFTTLFDTMPCPIINGITVPGITGTVVWQMTNGKYAGATITCTRRTANTTTTGVTVVGVPVINGVTTTTNDTPAVNTLVSAVFLKVST